MLTSDGYLHSVEVVCVASVLEEHIAPVLVVVNSSS